jgi:hypothetical protein
VLSLALAISIAAAPASSDERKEAGAHYQRAVGFYKEGDFKGALTEFRAAYDLLPSFEVLFNIALCERRLFNYARAMRTLDQYLMEGGQKVPAERREAVARELEAIKVLTAPVAVIVEGAPATVLVDGEKVGETPLSELLVLSVGKHTVRAERAGCSPDEKRLEVKSGQAQSVTLAPASLTAPVEVAVECGAPNALVSVDGQAGVACPGALSLAPGSHELVGRAKGFIDQRTEVLVQPGQARKVSLSLVALPPPAAPFPTLGVSLLGAGVVAGGLGIYFASAASQSAQRTSTIIRAGGPWDAAAVANQEAGQRDALLGWTFLGVGAGALAAGAVSLALHARAPAETEVSVTLVPGGLAACATF